MGKAIYINRKEYILKNKFKQYLLPSIMITIASSLSEFVDGIVVSNLLGSSALSIVNMGMPIMLVGSFCYVLIGNGGQIEYIISMGRMNSLKAHRIYTVSVLTMLLQVFSCLYSDVYSQAIWCV